MRQLMSALSLTLVTGLAGCGVVYHSPSMNSFAPSESRVRVESVTPESVMVANRSPYEPLQLPAVFRQVAQGSGLRGNGVTLPEQVFDRSERDQLALRVPPPADPGPYRIGVGDVVLFATPQGGNTIEQLAGLLEAQNSRQGYTVQDDGAIAIPNVGRVVVAGMTTDEAEAQLFQRLVENQIDPTFSLEIADFNSKKVAIGGAVGNPSVVPISLTPLYLDEALTRAGGITVTDQDYASVRIYRDGTLYQIPLTQLYSDDSLQQIRLVDGDSVFVDTAYDLELAQAYFNEQIQRANFRQSSRAAAISQLNSEMALQRASLSEARSNYLTLMQQGAVRREHVYLAGEVGAQNRYTLPFEQKATLADAIFENGGLPTARANARQVYVLRGSPDPREFSSITAWNLNLSNASSLILATRFELRPNDVIFVAEQPVTRWNRVLNQIMPTLYSVNNLSE